MTWPDDIEKSCKNCAFYRAINPHAPQFGNCVRHAPVICYQREGQSTDARWPLVNAAFWCGDGEPSIYAGKPHA